jgi:hypothetical protein
MELRMSFHILSVSCWAYSGLLHAYPAEFRNEFGPEMMQVFQEGCRASIAQRKLVVLMAFWVHILSDLFISAGRERFTATNVRSFAVLFLAISLGVWIGLVDYRSNEVQNAVLLIVLSTFFFGLIMPRGAWVRAVIIGLGVPAIHYIADWNGLKPPYSVEPGIYASFLALIPAVIGTYLGVLVRWFFAAAAAS